MFTRITWFLVLAACVVQLPANCWYSYVEGEGWGGDWHQGGGANVFVPVYQNGYGLLFAEGRGQRLKRQSIGSGGIGYRRLVLSNLAFGVNGFLDYCRSDTAQSYLQFGVGGELLGPCWEARVNGYFPHRDCSRLLFEQRTDEAVLEGVNVIDRMTELSEKERAYTGFDIEGGYVRCFGPGYVRAYAGYFYYASNGMHDIQGPRFRVMYDWDDPFGFCGARLSIGTQYTYDRVRRTEWGGYAILRIPLTCWKRGRKCWKSSLCRRMNDRVWRERGVVLETERTETVDFIPVLGPDGNQLQFFFVDAIGGGPGTQTDPTTLDTAEALSGPEDVIFCLNDEGPILVNDSFIMEELQQLIGFGDQPTQTVVFSPELQFTVVDLTASGRAILTRDAADNITTIADSVNVEGLEFDGGFNGIEGNNNVNVRIQDMIFENMANNGINIPGSINALIDQAVFNNIGNTAIFLNATSPVMRNITISGAGGNGIHLVNASDPTIEQATIDQVSGISMLFDTCTGTAAVNTATVTDSGTHSVQILNGTANFTFTNNALEQTGNEIVVINGSSGNANFTGGSLLNTSGAGILVQNTTGGQITFNNTPRILSATSPALTFANNAAAIGVTNAELTTGANVTGVVITDGTMTGDVTFTGSTLTQTAGGTAVDVDGTAATIDCSGLTIDNDMAIGVNGLRVQNTTAGEVLFGQVMIDNHAGPDGVLLDLNDADITVDTLTINTSGTTGVGGQMGDGNILFTQLNVDGANRGVMFGGTDTDAGGFTVTGDGSTAGSGGTITNVTLEGVLATDIAALSLALMNIEGGVGTNAVFANNLLRASTIDIDRNTLTSDTDALAVLIEGLGSAQVAVDGNTLNSSGAAGAKLESTTATVSDLTITSFANNTVPTIVGQNGGIVVDRAQFDNSGPVSGGTTQIGTVGRLQGVGLSLNDVEGSLSFTDLDILNEAGTGLFIRDAGGKGGSFTFATTDGTIDTLTAPAMDIDPVTFNSTWSSVTSANSPSEGVLLNTVAGTLDIQGGSITGAVGASFSIQGASSVDVTYSGTITNTTDRMIDIADATGGSATFNGASYTDTNADGVIAANSAMNVSLVNAAISGGATDGVTLTNTSGSFSLTDSTITDRPVGISAMTSGSLSVEGCMLTNIAGDGATILWTGTSTGTLTFDSNPSISNIGGDAINLLSAATGGSVTLNVTNNPFVDTITGNALTIDTDAGSDNTTLVFNIDSNTFSNLGNHGIESILNSNGALPVSVFGTVTNNTFNNTGNVGPDSALDFRYLGPNAGGSYLVEIDSNSTTNTGQSAVLVQNVANGFFSVNVFSHSDTDSAQGAVVEAYRVINSLVGSTLCADLNNNNTNNAGGILIQNTGGGSFDVAGGEANLSANNNGISVTSMGAFGVVGSCQLPP